MKMTSEMKLQSHSCASESVPEERREAREERSDERNTFYAFEETEKWIEQKVTQE